jgi:hypothetical protein
MVSQSEPSNVALHKTIEIQLFLSRRGDSQQFETIPHPLTSMFQAPCMSSSFSHIFMFCRMNRLKFLKVKSCKISAQV